MLPYQAGNWRTWKDWHGIASQYRAWRGPLSVTASGDVLWVQAHIRYWIRAQKKAAWCGHPKGSCGIDEAPRQTVIGMQVLLEWGPDWTLRPRFRLLPTRFLDRCEMTIANIDVTSVVETEFRKQMQDSLRAALKTLAPGLNAIRTQAQRSWSVLQEPVELGQDNWLLLSPASVALSRIAGRGKYLCAQLALTLQPVLVSGSEPAVKPVPLPPLGQYYPRSTGLSLHVGVNLDFPTLNQRLSDTLAGKSLVIKGHKAGIKTLDLAGSGQEIRARMELAGELAGSADLRARVAYDAQQRKLELQDLTFDYEPIDSTPGVLAEAFHEPMRQTLDEAEPGAGSATRTAGRASRDGADEDHAGGCGAGHVRLAVRRRANGYRTTGHQAGGNRRRECPAGVALTATGGFSGHLKRGVVTPDLCLVRGLLKTTDPLGLSFLFPNVSLWWIRIRPPTPSPDGCAAPPPVAGRCVGQAAAGSRAPRPYPPRWRAMTRHRPAPPLRGCGSRRQRHRDRAGDTFRS